MLSTSEADDAVPVDIKIPGTTAQRNEYNCVIRGLDPYCRSPFLSHRIAVDCGGTIAVLSAFTLALLVGFTGLAIDVGMWEMHKRDIQGTADSAAYSAAVAIGAGENATQNAKGITAQMGFPDGVNGVFVTVVKPPTTGTYAGNNEAVQVTVSAPQQSYFSKLYLSSAPTAAASAIGLFGNPNSQYCILSLDSSSSGAVTMQGSTAMDLSGCGMQVNSSSSSALSLGGGASLTADSLSITGSYSLGSNATLIASYENYPGASPLKDPYAGVSIPSYTGCDQTNYHVSGTVTLHPGVYCKGINFNAGAVATLASGVYIIDRGSFDINGGATVTGSGVTIILTSSTGSQWATVTVNGSTTVNLSSQNSGDYSGLVFFEDRNAPEGTQTAATLNGGTGQTYNGALYFPSTDLTYSGGSSSAQCTQIIAMKITFTGSSTVNSNCIDYGTKTVTGYSTMVAG